MHEALEPLEVMNFRQSELFFQYKIICVVKSD